MLAGLRLALRAADTRVSSPPLRFKVEDALVTAVNLALREDQDSAAAVGKHALVLTLTLTFESLSERTQSLINYDHLLPGLLHTAFLSQEGLWEGYWLSTIDRDVAEVPGRKFAWSTKSPTYGLVQGIHSRPLIKSLGPLSRLIAHAVLRVSNPQTASLALVQIVDFARTLSVSWRQNKLSEIDPLEESNFLDDEAVNQTLPALWSLLRLALFACVIVLRAVLERALLDPGIAQSIEPPELAKRCLSALRYLYFIASRLGHDSSSQYLFAIMAATDILSQYPDQTQRFLLEIRPPVHDQIPPHPADRCFDLFFLNAAESFTQVLPATFNEEVVLASAMPYLAINEDQSLINILEAAHSVALSLFAHPQNADVASRHIPFYLDTLFSCFPRSISARQFKLAFRTMIRACSPPSPLAQSHPLLPSVLLEIVAEKAKYASSYPLPRPFQPASQQVAEEEQTSEQAALLLAIIDSLCFLHPDLLDEWLPLTAAMVSNVQNPTMQTLCREAFWEAISSGIMDVERAALCVAWWNSNDGREQLLFEQAPETRLEMSGALPMDSKL